MQNYWFLYNLSDGSIYGSPYLGLAEEWTNIPDGCGVIGAIEESDATAMDAFANPHYYLVQDGQLVEKTDLEEIKLSAAKQAKIAELNQACNQAIFGRFKSTVNSVDYYFSNDTEAQSNFKDAIWAFQTGKVQSITWTAYDVDGNVVRISLDQASLESVNFDRIVHQNIQVSKLRDTLEPQVKDATDEETVKAIVW